MATAELQRQFRQLVVKNLLSYGTLCALLFLLVYSLFCIQDGNDNVLSLIRTNCNG